LPVLNPATQAIAKRRAVAIPRSQNCPIAAAFSALVLLIGERPSTG